MHKGGEPVAKVASGGEQWLQVVDIDWRGMTEIGTLSFLWDLILLYLSRVRKAFRIHFKNTLSGSTLLFERK